MAYQVRTEQRPTAGNLDGTVLVLEDPADGVRADICPALGWNCFHWQVVVQGRPLDLLYADPQLFAGAKPTRSGIPVLFPFPNRIRAGRFAWGGQEYQLPLNDSTAQNAIHGFACRRPWRIVDQGSDATAAWVTGEFWASHDAADVLALWPADYRIRLTHRLEARRLRIEALVENPDRTPLPCGLGFHPYFRSPLLPGGSEEQCWVEAAVDASWELVDSLPTGRRLPLDPAQDLAQRRRVSELNLDALFAAAGCPPIPGDEGLCFRGSVTQAPEGVGIRLATSPTFRDLVVFTPPHRQAVCLEPYTCITDAINLQPQGVDAGLLVLPPGETWSGVVEMSLMDHPSPS